MSEYNKQLLPRGWKWTTIEEVTEPKVTQASPEGEGEFIYVDISSIDIGRLNWPICRVRFLDLSIWVQAQ